jgi:predicted Zn finger-like uncharacterized protein
MDVQCERCKTEYEFDDALVSGRGTTVRCTNCGHQFKVRSTDATDPGSDQWLVHTGAGHRLTFVSLRELQRAILARQVSRTDVLVRGGGAPRSLGSIAELEPFFEGRAPNRAAAAAGVAAVPPMQVPVPAPAGDSTSPVAFPKRPAHWSPEPTPLPFVARVPATAPIALPSARRTDSFGVAPVEPERPKIDTLRPPPEASAAPPPASRPQAVVGAGRHLAGAMTGGGANPDLMRNRSGDTAPIVLPEASSPLPPPTSLRRAPMRSEDDLQEMRAPMPSASLEDDLYPAPRRRRVGGWVVAFVLLLAVGVGTWAVARPYLVARNAGAASRLDPRARQFIADGERAMADGNLDSAQEAFDKASALAERDAHVLLDEARVSAARADLLWLKARLLPADAADETRTTKLQLDERVARALRAANDAVAVAPEDPAATRARLDALRLAGDKDAARALVSKVISLGSQAETAYVLAALDLAEQDPLWTTVIDRLRLATAGEGNAGRARAALVYALARAGDVVAAKAELAKLDALTRPFPLLPNLHAFVDRAPAKASAIDGGVAAVVPRVDVSALPAQKQSTPSSGASVAAAGGGTEATGGETSGGLQAAGHAIKRGDWNKARQIYEGLVARNPNDSEALAGIGDVDRAQGNPAGAIAAYKRALAVNPSYLPALLGVADTQWASGDRASATRAYKDIADRFPEGTYPSYVKGRAEGGAAPGTAGSAAAGSPSPGPGDKDGL